MATDHETMKLQYSALIEKEEAHKKKRREYARKRYAENEETRKRQNERMRAYRKRVKIERATLKAYAELHGFATIEVGN